MFNRTHRALILMSISAFAAPAMADDCAAAAKSAMFNSGRTPVTITITKTDAQGKKSTTRQVQTLTNKFVQTENGKWYAMNIAIKDLTDDLSTTKVTCHRSGSDSVNGEVATTYEVQVDLEEVMKDNKIWVSSRNLILKSEGHIEGAHYTTEYDYAHVTPPANAISMGGH
jgi:hypothetical protein